MRAHVPLPSTRLRPLDEPVRQVELPQPVDADDVAIAVLTVVVLAAAMDLLCLVLYRAERSIPALLCLVANSRHQEESGVLSAAALYSEIRSGVRGEIQFLVCCG